MQMESVNVAFSIQSTNLSGQITVAESPSLGSVINVTVQLSPTESAAHSTGQWTGWTIGKCSACSPTGTFAQIEDFGVSPTSSYCGASETLAGLCGISFWSGLTATITGAPSPEGIAQTGINAYEDCVWEVFFYDCSTEYQGWIEAWPADPVNCISIGASTDVIYSEVSWASPNTYYLTIWDDTSGAYCTTTVSMSMGTPYYGQFQSESISNGVGGILDVPSFNMWFNTAVVRGDPLNLNSDHAVNSLSVPGVNLDATPIFNADVCAGSGESCIQVYT